MYWVSVSPLVTGTLIAVYLVTLSLNMSQAIQHRTVGILLNTELKEVIIAYCQVQSNTYLVGLSKTMENLKQSVWLKFESRTYGI
jgi:hypothetical protein